MKYKCIKDKWYNDTKVMSENDIVVVSDDEKQVFNISTGVDIRNIPFVQFKDCLENLSDNCYCHNTRSPFENITKEMYETYKKKNHDYGNSFNESLDKFGLIASAVRIGDKMNRFGSLTQKEAQVSGESIRDTLLDMANYAIMTVMWMDKQ